MRKKISIILFGALLLLTSCVQKKSPEEILPTDEGAEQEISIVPTYKISEENYRMILPYRPSQARGVIVNQIANRLDINEVESGLRRLSTDVFDPDKYYFEEGQYLSEGLVYTWLGRTLTKDQLERAVEQEITRLRKDGRTVNEEAIRKNLQQGLNPAIKDSKNEKQQRESPRYISHILEHNFLEKNDEKVTLKGVSIAISLKSVYRFQTETGGPYLYEKIPQEEMLREGKAAAEKMIERLRAMEELAEIPIMIALYEEQEQGSPISGNFVARTTVASGEDQISDWEKIDEENILFPSEEAKSKYVDDYEVMQKFGNDVAEYFPNYVGYIGKGFYSKGDLQKLTIEIPIELYSAGEVIGFTQYVYGVVLKNFSNHYDIEITISSANRVESFIYREAGEEEPVVHIFD